MKRIKLITLTILTAATVAIFSTMSKTVVSSVKYSLGLCYSSVIPSLFPFFILCEFFMQVAGGITKRVTLTTFFSGLITGFPTGVNNVCKLYQAGSIDKSTAVSLLHCTANASPAYIVTFIGACIIKNRAAGFALLAAQTAAAFACAVFFRCFNKNEVKCGGVINITEAASRAVTNSVTNCLYVCGYITFFGIFADILKKWLFFIPANRLKAVMIGAIEITRGMELIDFNDKDAIVTAAVILAFSGISVIMQCVNCAVKVGLPAKPIVTGKLIYAAIMPGIAYIIHKLMPAANGTQPQNPYESITAAVTVLVFLLFCIIAVYNIFDKSRGRLYNK